jgi:hypothetical protein
MNHAKFSVVEQLSQFLGLEQLSLVQASGSDDSQSIQTVIISPGI